MAIYVGNLSYNLSETELAEVFSEYGNVSSAKIIIDRQTGRSKGFGFVEMENDGDETAAIDALNGADIKGRTLKANKARERE